MCSHAKIAPVAWSPNICWLLVRFFFNFAIIDSCAFSKYKASDFLLGISTLLTEIPLINFFNTGDSMVDNGSILMKYFATRALMVVGETDAFVISVYSLWKISCSVTHSHHSFLFSSPSSILQSFWYHCFEFCSLMHDVQLLLKISSSVPCRREWLAAWWTQCASSLDILSIFWILHYSEIVLVFPLIKCYHSTSPRWTSGFGYLFSHGFCCKHMNNLMAIIIQVCAKVALSVCQLMMMVSVST